MTDIFEPRQKRSDQSLLSSTHKQYLAIKINELQKVISMGFATTLLIFSPLPAIAGMCEEQLEIPWRREVASGKLPLNILFDLKPDGTVGGGVPNAVIDRPFYNNFQKGVYILFTNDRAEIFPETNNQGYIPQCEFVPLAGIAIGGKIATVERILSAKPYMNLTKLSPDAIKLISESNGETAEFLTAPGRRFPIGSRTVSALKSMYQEQQSTNLKSK